MTNLKAPGSIHSASSRHAHGPSNPFAKALLEAGGSMSTDAAISSLELGADMLTSLMGAGEQNVPSLQGTLRAQLQSEENSRMQDIWNSNMLDESEEFPQEQSELMRARRQEQANNRLEEQQHVSSYDARSSEREQRVQELMMQLRTISQSAGEQAQTSQITALQGVVGKAGEYHVTFLEKIVRFTTLLNQRTNQSHSWMSQSNARQGAKQGYWSMFHKHGTQWSQSGERAIVTSVG